MPEYTDQESVSDDDSLLLNEDGTFILNEDGTYILLEDSTGSWEDQESAE